MSTDRIQRAPAVLLPYQQRWVADRSKVKIVEKSRRTGFSWSAAADAALEAGSAKGQDQWYLGYNRDMAKEFILDAADWAGHFGKVAVQVEETLLDDGDREPILTFVIRFASGFRVSALSSRPTNLRSKQGHVILDEFAFHDKPGELLKAALAMLIWGGRVSIISTHDGVDNAFHELIGEVRAGKKPYSLHRVTLDDAIAEGLYQRICLRLGTEWAPAADATWRDEMVRFYGDGAEEELFCVPRNSGGAYIPRALIEARMKPAPIMRLALADSFVHESDDARKKQIEEWCNEHLAPLLAALPKDLRHAFGEDFGRDGHLTVIAPVSILRTLLRRVPFLVELRNVPFKEQAQILFYIGDRLPRLSGGALDKGGNGAFLSEVAMQRYGAGRITQVALSDKWYSEHCPPFKAAFEDGSFEPPRDDDVLQDLRQLQVIRGVPKIGDKERTGADGGKRHGDAAIALLLAHFASSLEGAPIEFQAAGTRESLELATGFGRNDFRGF